MIKLTTAGRGVDMLLATALAVYPLLPSGPVYFGLANANYSEIGFVILLCVWLVGRVREPRSTRDGGAVLEPGREVLWAWCAFMAIATGSAFVGLSAENDFSSPVFWAYVRQLPVSVGLPMDMLSDPMYPVAVWLVLIQGGLAFAVVRDLCLRASDPRRRARTALYGWLTGYGLVAVVAIAQYATRFKLHPYWVKANPDLVRSHSTLEDPNILGSYLVLGLGLVLGLILIPRAAGTRAGRLILALGILGVTALYTTVSRSAWVGFPLALTLFLAFTPREWVPHFVYGQRHLRLAARSLLLGLIIVGSSVSLARVLIPPDVEAHFQPANPLEALVGTLDPRLPLSQGYVLGNRIDWWGAALTMFEERPLVGVGLGRYPRLVPAYSSPNVPPENAHSFWLQVLGEMGGLGFVGFVLFVLTLSWSLAAASRAQNREDAALARGGLLGTTAFLVTCVTGHPLLLASGQTVFATVLAVVLVGSVDYSRDPREDDAPVARSPKLPGEQPMWKQVTVSIAGILLLCYPARALGEWPPPGRDSMWGYSWGLFPEESTGSAPYRWTGQQALIDIDVPSGSTLLHLDVAAPNPIRDGQPTQVRFQLGRQVEYRTFSSADQVIVPLAILPEDIDEGGIQLTIEVEPVFVPSESSESDDTRELGLQLFGPRWN